MKIKKIYVPILKWKRAEHRALKGFPVSQRDVVTPLVEVVLPMVDRFKDKARTKKKTDEEMFAEIIQKYKTQRIPKIPQEIEDFWGTNQIYVDFSLIHNGTKTVELKVESMEKILTKTLSKGLSTIPVVNLTDAPEITQAARKLVSNFKTGACIRIQAFDLADVRDLDRKLDTLIVELDVTPEQVDLLIDLKDLQSSLEYGKFFNSAQSLRHLNRWREFIFASGAFPASLAQCKRDEPTTIPRNDWLNWRHFSANSDGRLPTYADYTIRTPLFDESLQYKEPTTSIKYALENGWYVLKGVVRGFEYFLGNAKLLVESSGKFYGENFSTGDKYIKEKSDHYDNYVRDPSIKGTGTNESWISAGISHHLALVVHQVSNPGKKVSRALAALTSPDQE